MKNKRLRWYLFFGIVAIALFSWDLASVTQVQIDYPLYKKLADIDSTRRDSTKVAIIGSDYTDLSNPVSLTTTLTQAQIDSMVWKALDLQGSAVKLLKPGVKVLIKPNIVGAVADQIGENTDTRVVKAIVKYVHQKTGGNCSIKIGEGSPRPMPYETGFSGGTAAWKELWDLTGYPAMLDELKGLGINVDTVNLNGGCTVNPLQNLTERTVPHGGYATPQHGKYYINNAIIQADVYITVPVLKVHNPGITAALKNQIGTAPGNRYGFNKVKGVLADGSVNKLHHNDDAPRDWTDEEIVDLCLLDGIDLVVVDATLCLEKQKSFSKTLANQVRLNAIVVGNDPVAVDNVCSRMTGFNPDDIDHIALAELAGIGTNDPSLITLVGSPLAHVTKRLKKLTGDPRLMFGQTNRKWLVSAAFPVGSISNPIANNFIANEATVEPKPGVGGWSVPMYFFDDNIDLGNYFSYVNNIVAYAFTYVYAPKETDALLQVGSDESMYLYLNHALAYSYSGVRIYNYIAETKTIHLKQGMNTLLIKTLQTTGNHDFAMNICEVETNAELVGNRVEGLKFYPTMNGAVALKTTISAGEKMSCSPNPASSFTTIRVKGDDRILVYDLKGKLVRTLVSKGSTMLEWDLCDSRSVKVEAGVYVAKSTLSGQSIKISVKK
jgi:uncharacterized protein (DUF362 family)